MKVAKIVGWVLTILIVALFTFSGTMKLVVPAGMEEQLAKMGLTLDLVKKIGILELVITLIFLIPQSAFIGAILLTGYMGGAIMTHLKMGEPFIMHIVIGVLIWVALGLRDSRIFTLALGQKPKESL